MTLDLTGLPPTLDELDEFLGDEEPGAYERVVNRLLGSQHFGEHMARFWLDAARYGDTHGLHLDNYREMWPYRDWVIGAFNRNLPFDQFVIEQLAGDLLPDATDDQLIATGFNRCHVTTNEGGSITEEVYVRNVVDRVVTFSTVFMGVTFECTRCHDHKYDPFTMNDFYSLFGYFNSLDGNPMDGNRKDPAPVLRVPTTTQRAQMAEFAERVATLETKLKSPWPAVDAEQQAWEQSLRAQVATGNELPQIGLGQWHVLGPFVDVRRYLFSRKHGPEGNPVDLKQSFQSADGSTLSWEPRPEWTDGQIHSDLSGDLAANFLYRLINSPDERSVQVFLGSDDAIKVFLNGEQVFANDTSRGVAADQDSIELKLQPGSNELLLKVINYGGQTGFYFRTDAEAATMPPEIAQILQRADEDRSDEQRAELRDFYRIKVSGLEEIKEAQAEIARLREATAEVERGIATTLIWREKKEPVTAYLLKRGEYDQRAGERPRAVPTALPGLPEGVPNDRLGLARWLVSGQHPLTARVTVNRFWQQVFGTGLVKTSEDFGTRGERPSHPELLDWLAMEFVADGWDIKAMMERLVLSSTYRQSSHLTPEKLARDPANRLVSRGPRFRLDAEMLRDQALAVGGVLSDRMGGPSVKPPQPDGLWFAVGYSGSNTVRFKPDQGHDLIHRRTIYTFIKRTAPPPQMSTFDGPSRESCSVRRERTNTPLQALLLFNDPQYVEAARGLAQRTLREAGPTPEARAQQMFRRCTCRWPTEEELADLMSGYEADLAEFSRSPESAQQLLQTGSTPIPPELDPNELAAWTMIGNLLLNLDEVLTKN